MRDVDHFCECLYRLAEFRQWVETNVLFPQVPDSIVHPLRDRLRDAERALVTVLYGEGQVERVAAIQRQLQPAPRSPPPALAIRHDPWPET